MPTTALQVRDIESARLSNGIRVISESMSHVRSVALGIWICTGSRRESKERMGVSHFLEHMLFKGTPTRSAEDIARQVDSIGGNLDAFTGKELVSFNTKVLDEHLPQAFDIVSDMVLHPMFREEDIEKEKGVILEELKMEQDSPEGQAHEIFASSFWKNHALGRSILGSKKTIASFTRPALAEYHRQVYVPSNMLITAAGNLQHERLVRLAEEVFGPMGGDLPTPAEPEPRTFAELNLKKRNLKQAHLFLGVPTYPVAHEKRYACYIMNTLLGSGMSSRLFQNIRERRGLAYAIFSELNLYRDTGCLAVYAGTAVESTATVTSLILEEFRRLKDERVPGSELRRAKDHLKGSLMLGLESTSSRMANLARQKLYFDRFYSLDELIEGIEQVTADDLQTLAIDSFRSELLALTVLGRTDQVKIGREHLVC